MFADRPEILRNVITSAQFQKEKKYKEVDGPYTDKGHYFVLVNIEQGLGLLEKEAWVVPLGPDETKDRIQVHLRRLGDDYESRYIESWTDWVADLRVQSPQTLKDAVSLYGELTKPDWPYLRILRAVEDHTQFTKDQSVFQNQAVNREANRKLNEAIRRKTQGIMLPKVEMDKIAKKQTLIPTVFKSLIQFGIPVDTKNRTGGAPIGDTPLAKYMNMLGALKDEMQRKVEDNQQAPAQVMNERLGEVTGQATALLKPFDDKAKQLMTPLLVDPLKIVGTALPDQGANKQNVNPGGMLPKFRPGKR
jgi:type VI secretion system protein ImpL